MKNKLQAFCIDNTKIPDANTLFKMLKSVDGSGNVAGSGGANKSENNNTNNNNNA